MTSWVPSPAISGPEDWNRLELTCSGTTISVAVNGVELAAVEDDTYREGALAVEAGLFVEYSGPLDARFDNLVVTGPPA